MSTTSLTPGALRAAGTVLRTVILKSMEGVTPTYQAHCHLESSAGAARVLYTCLGDMPTMREFMGKADIQEAVFTGWEVPNKPYHNTLGVPREDMERGDLSGHTLRLQMMGNDAAIYPDLLKARKLMAGFVDKCYTGKKFFDTGHRHFPGGKVTFDNVSALKLTSASYDAAITSLLSVMQEDKVTPFNRTLNLELIVGPKNRAAAKKILEASLINGGDDNTNKGTAKLVLDPLITNDSWYLINLSGVVRPLVFQEEVKTETNFATDHNTADFILSQKHLFQVYRRCNLEYLFPQCAYGSTGTDNPA